MRLFNNCCNLRIHFELILLWLVDFEWKLRTWFLASTFKPNYLPRDYFLISVDYYCITRLKVYQCHIFQIFPKRDPPIKYLLENEIKDFSGKFNKETAHIHLIDHLEAVDDDPILLS